MTYQVFFNLDDAPFGLPPDPQYFFPSLRHNEALDTLIYCVESGEGFAQITGQPGVGKTLLIRSFLDQLSDNVNTALILHPRLEAEDLFKVILEDLGLASDKMQEMSKESLLRSFRDILLESAGQGKQTLVIIDEAQEIPEKTLEELRLLSNLETNKAKLLQIVLVGQLELEEKLQQDKFKQLRQRITVCYRLDPLTFDETVNYIHHRLKVAGGGTVSRFSPKVIKKIHAISNGIPRIINTLCERSLMAAFVDGKSTINNDHLHNAARSLGYTIRKINGRSGKTRLALLLSTVLILAGTAIYYTHAPLQQLVSLKTNQFKTYWQATKTNLNASPTQEIVEKKATVEIKAAQKGLTITAGKDSDQNEPALLINKVAEDTVAVHADQEHAETVLQENEEIARKQMSQHEEHENLASNPSDSAQETEDITIPDGEKIPAGTAGQQATPEIEAKPAGLPRGWKSIVIDQNQQKAFLFQSSSLVPIKELALPKPTTLEDGIYLLGQDQERPYLFNHRSFFAWQENPSLSSLLLQQFSDETSPAVIPVIVSSVESERSLSQQGISEIRTMVQEWAGVHSQKDVQKVMRYYDDSLINYKLFSNNPTVKSHAQVAARKTSIFEKNKAVFLQISDPACIVNSEDPSQAIALFYQRFVSSSYQDSGVKVLYLRKTGATASNSPHWLITGTLWLPSREEKKETHP